MRVVFMMGLILFIQGVQAQTAGPFYFVGSQKVSETDSKECFVELGLNLDFTAAQIRALVTNSHEGSMAALGPLNAQYQYIAGSIKKNGFYFQDKAPQAPVKQFILVSEDPQNPTSMMAAIFHDGHHDPVACENLVLAEGEKLQEALDLFEEFEHLKEHAH